MVRRQYRRNVVEKSGNWVMRDVYVEEETKSTY